MRCRAVPRRLGVGLVLAGSSAAVIFAYVVRFLAIAIGFAQAGLARISHRTRRRRPHARRGPVGLVWPIHLPLLRPALWGAALLVFVDCLRSCRRHCCCARSTSRRSSTYIYQFATRGNFEEGSLAALLIVVVGIVPVIWMVRHAEDLSATSRAVRRKTSRPPLDRGSLRSGTELCA